MNRAPIIHTAPQGSAEWHRARAGVLTASQFDRILTPAKLELAKGRLAYLCEVAGSEFMGACEEIGGSVWMERGTELEPEAREAYQLITGRTVSECGIVFMDSTCRIGASPDGIVTNAEGDIIGGLELKCPKAGTHVGYLVAGELPADYRHQVQGCLYVTGAAWWDFMSYYPGLPLFVKRAYPDPAYFAALDDALPVVLEELDAIMAKIRGDK